MRSSLANAAVLLSLSLPTILIAQSAPEDVTVDAHGATTPFPHFWEKTFGSGRAVLALRQDYRDNLDAVHQATNFESVRFHGIFNDEVGLYDPDRQGKKPGVGGGGGQGGT